MNEFFKLRNQQFKVKKNWGYEIWIDNNEKYCGKILHIRKGKFCSWHYHAKKEETLYLQHGQVLVWYSSNDDIEKAENMILNPGDSFHVPIGLRHRMKALKCSNIFEFSTTHYDEDSIRILAGS